MVYGGPHYGIYHIGTQHVSYVQIIHKMALLCPVSETKL